MRLAAEIGVDTVITFSGCPGESEHSLRPSWVTCSWPDDFPETLAWQWDERVLPYWADAAAFAEQHGIRVAIEPHPGFVVYNTASMLRLRESAGDERRRQLRSLAPVLAGHGSARLRATRSGMRSSTCMRRTPASRTSILALNGVLEPIPGDRAAERSWIFRSVGAGHPVEFWRDLVAALRAAGYDGALSIEHEDPLLSHADGLELAVTTLRAALGRGGLADA